METWYEISWDDEIRETRVVKSTEHMLILEGWKGNNRRVRKGGWRSQKYFPTKKEAIDNQRTELEESVSQEKQSLTRSEGRLTNFNKKYPK